MEKTNMIKKNIILIGPHESGKRIFLYRLLNEFDPVVNYDSHGNEIFTLSIIKKTEYYLNDDDSQYYNVTESQIQYDFNITVISMSPSLIDQDISACENADIVLFFCKDDILQQVSILYLKSLLTKQIPCKLMHNDNIMIGMEKYFTKM